MPPAVCRDTARCLPPCFPLSAAVLLPAVCRVLPAVCRRAARGCCPPAAHLSAPPRDQTIPSRRLPRRNERYAHRGDRPAPAPRASAAAGRGDGEVLLGLPSFGLGFVARLTPSSLRRVAFRGGGASVVSRVVCCGALPVLCVCCAWRRSQDYFGEKLALQMSFLCHYTTWLIPLAVGGVARLIEWIKDGCALGCESSRQMIHITRHTDVSLSTHAR